MPIPLGILAVAGAGGVALTNDYELIETFEANTNTTSVTFSSIPQTYKHLQIRHSIRSGQSGTAITFRMIFNGVNTGTPYDSHALIGNGTSVTWAVNNSENYILAGMAAGSSGGTNVHGAGVIDILDYAQTTKNKTIRCFGGARPASGPDVSLRSGQWRSSSAITSITFSTVTPGEFLIASFHGTSRFSLYGVK